MLEQVLKARGKLIFPSEILEHIRIQKSLKKSDIYNALNESSQNYNNWVKRGAVPMIWVGAICDYLNIPTDLVVIEQCQRTEELLSAIKTEIDKYLSKELPNTPLEQNNNFLASLEKVPKSNINSRFCDQIPLSKLYDYFNGNYKAVKSGILDKHPKSSFIVLVDNDSMENPHQGISIPPGSEAVIEPSQEMRPSKFYLVHNATNDTYFIRQFVSDGNESLLKPLNPIYSTINVSENTQFIGRVASIITDF